MIAASDKLIYECEFCEEQLGPEASCCHRCGQEFDDPVPADAAPPTGTLRLNRHGTSQAACETIVLGPRRRLSRGQPSPLLFRLPALRRLTRHWHSK